MPLRQDPKQQARLKAAPVQASSPPTPSLAKIYAENRFGVGVSINSQGKITVPFADPAEGSLLKAFEDYDEQQENWRQQVSQHLSRIVSALSVPNTRSQNSPVVAYRLYNIASSGIVIQPAEATFGPEFSVVEENAQHPEWAIYNVTMPEGYEDRILKMSFTLGAYPFTEDDVVQPAVGGFTGPRQRTQLAGGEIGYCSFQRGTGATRQVWAGDPRLILDSIIPNQAGDVYHTPIPIRRMLLEVI